MLKKEKMHAELLERLVEEQKLVKIFIVNGFQITGRVKDHDEDSIMIEDERGRESIVFKRAVSTITVT